MDQNEAGWLLLSSPSRSAEDLAQAIVHFEAALAEDASHGVAFTNLVDALLAAGRLGDAVARAERGTHEAVAARAHNWLGWYHGNKTGDRARALAHFKAAVDAATHWGVAHLNYATALEASGALDDAYVEYGHALAAPDAHDIALAHARRAAIEYRRGWLRSAHASTRRAVFREERAPRGRLELWRVDEAKIESEVKGPFPSRAAERAWIAQEMAGVDGMQRARAWLDWAMACEEEVTPAGPLAVLETALRARDTAAAVLELAALRARDVGLIVDAIGLLERYGERAAREDRRADAKELLRFALEGYEIFASWSTSGAEGMGRMVDVHRLRERLSSL